MNHFIARPIYTLQSYMDSFPLVLGDREAFAIQIDVNRPPDYYWYFGRIGYLVDHREVGDYQQITSLSTCYAHARYLFHDAHTRTSTRFFGHSKETIVDQVWTTLYDDDRYKLATASVNECWHKHLIKLPIDVFDGLQVLQFDEDAESRIIWFSTKTGAPTELSEVRIVKGATEASFAQLKEVLETLLDM